LLNAAGVNFDGRDWLRRELGVRREHRAASAGKALGAGTGSKNNPVDAEPAAARAVAARGSELLETGTTRRSKAHRVIAAGRFQAEWVPVRVKKTRQTKIGTEPAPDLIRTGEAA
jgi:hypothetical protein